MKLTSTLSSIAAGILFATTAFAQDSCPGTVSLNAPLSGVKVVEQASEHLTATNKIQSGDVSYQAGQSVTLTAGFEVKPGAVFNASIAKCSADEKSRTDLDEKVLALGAYPNPFAENTLIEYSLPKSSKVSLSIATVQGITIAKLISDQEQPVGTHRVTFESQTLPDGVYICTLNTPEGRKTYKIVKQK
ncbi:T9SS type A sorting domain-containing protein [Telluribacter humicola]|uniref:T9SS type A sorting domain-containing protein n=1 Tax=Telluribacter humicola TaxID=1720261 RepID=UPI001A956E04|nr:T9SS type A sorting domain-containing protein [Telluribacter humicola]